MLTSNGGETILHNFGSSSTDGIQPVGTPTLGSDGNYYGTTFEGGLYQEGTLYQVTPGGGYTLLYSFGSNGTDGDGPKAGLFVGNNGLFYGVTAQGGQFNKGTIFSYSMANGTNILYNYGANASDGNDPIGTLIEDAHGNFYGTTYQGGSAGYGTLFKLKSGGGISILHSFGAVSNDGQYPMDGVTADINGNLYGTTTGGGQNNLGSVFEVDASGAYSVLHSFAGGADGSTPYASLLIASDNNVYGTATKGGTHNFGTIFSFPLPKPTITSFSPTSGRVKTEVTITGTNFKGATLVEFDGVPSNTFNVNSTTTIKALVPSGATTGPITVVVPAGSVTSMASFTVTVPIVPTISSFSPQSGPVGTAATITGTNLTGTTVVSFNGPAATKINVLSSTSVRVLVPAGATSGQISVTTPNGNATSTGVYAVGSLPTITSFTPGVGQPDQTVTITGTNFTGATAVLFNGLAASSFTIVSASSVTAIVPTGATTGKITVTTPVGSAVSSTNFTIAVPPTISTFSPASGHAGTAVTITGTNLTDTTSVAFNNTPVSKINVLSSTSIRVLVPAGATTGLITLAAPGGDAESSTSFTVD